MAYTMSKARSDSMTVMTSTITLIGRIAGNTTRRNVCTGLAPSMTAASLSAGSTDFRPAKYRIMMYPTCRHPANSSTIQILRRESPKKSMPLPWVRPRIAFTTPWSWDRISWVRKPMTASDSATGRYNALW